MAGVCGLMAIETTAAAVTVKVVDALTDPEVMLIVVVPAPSVVVSPLVVDELLIVATVGSVELQCPIVVRSWVELSVYRPVAVNCCV